MARNSKYPNNTFTRSPPPKKQARMLSDTVLVFERPVVVAATRMLKEPGSQPATLQFCRAHSLIPAKASKRDGAAAASLVPAKKLYSHYSYKNLWDLGKLEVSIDRTRGFYKALLADFNNGWFAAFTENPGEGCMPMYFDYDLWSRTYPTEEFWARMEALEKAEIRRFFPGHLPTDPIFVSTVATSGVVDVTKEDGTKWFKCGIHIYYKNMHVDLEMALFLSTAVVAAAEKAWPHSDMTWEKQIDRGVYGPARGLRMVYMFKAKECPKCAVGELAEDRRRKVRGERCSACDGSRVVADTAASMYAPLYRVDGNARRAAIRPATRNHPTLDLMLECSIRAVHIPGPSDGFTIYPGAVPIPHMKAPGRGAAQLTCSGEQQLAKSTKTAQEIIVRDTPRWTALQSIVRRAHAMYADLNAKGIFKHRDGSYKVRNTFVRLLLFLAPACGVIARWRAPRRCTSSAKGLGFARTLGRATAVPPCFSGSPRRALCNAAIALATQWRTGAPA